MQQSYEHNYKLKLIMRGILLFVFFFALYLIVSSYFLLKTNVFIHFNVLLGTDIPRVIGDMTIYNGDHYRTEVHPIYVLLMNPIGRSLVKIIGSELGAATLLNGFLGAAGVVLSFIFFSLYLERVWDAWLLAFIFGMSASQLIFSTVPETSSLATCSLIVTYILFIVSLKNRRSLFPVWVLAGIFTLGVTLTNFVQSLICFGISSFISTHNKLIWFCKFFGFTLATFLITAALALLQKAWYPSSTLFFLPEAHSGELNFTNLLVFQKPLIVISQLFKHFLIIDFIAPHPYLLSDPNNSLPSVNFQMSSGFYVYGIIVLVLWIIWWISRISHFRADIKIPAFSLPLLLGLLLCLGFNFALHSLYGVEEIFLYTGNFTFPVLGILVSPNEIANKSMRILLPVLAIGLAINNLMVIAQIVHVYASLQR